MTNNKLFGTDGIRGEINSFPMTAEIAMRVGMVAGMKIRRSNPKNPTVIIGKDTRLSGYMIEFALTSGFTAVGVDVLLLGPMPTPAVAMLVHSMRADLAVMISASHNLHQDNGIKIFNADGYKLTLDEEDEIEKLVNSRDKIEYAKPEAVGGVRRLDGVHARYVEFAKHTLPRRFNLAGTKIVLDCANGAGYRVAPETFWELGAQVHTMFNTPNGTNINENCGSTSPAALQQAVVDQKADIGIALDGDADRLVVVDEKGDIIEGDQLIAALALGLSEHASLRNDCVVATVMSNMALELFLQDNGIRLIRVPVGDKYVNDKLKREGLNFGGEQSGHLIFSDFSTTGDGIVSALQLMRFMAEKNMKASEFCACFEPFTQVHKNVRVKSKNVLEKADVKQVIENAKAQLNSRSRLLIRPSGTEPVIRIMGEGVNESKISEQVEHLANYIQIQAENL